MPADDEHGSGSPGRRAPSPALQTDLYQLTMAAAYFAEGIDERRLATFELFVRHLPETRGVLIAAGLETALAYLESFAFSAEDVAHLRGLPVFAGVDPAFFARLERTRFTGLVWAVPEGTPVFENEPLLRVTAPILEAQLVETYLLSVITFQTLVASKAARVVEAAAGRTVVDFGTRRAHGPEAGVLAARAAYLAGCDGTSNVEAGRAYGIPVYGTMAHSYVQAHESEDEAFQSFAEVFPEPSVHLVDTYDTREAVRRLARAPHPVNGIRLDSGDLGALARECRAILDAAGRRETRIVASGDLDEHRVAELVREGAPIDAFGVGTRMVTSLDEPTLATVYKLVEIEERGERRAVRKKSRGKATWAGAKQVFRLRDAEGRPRLDLVGLAEEDPESIRREAIASRERGDTGDLRVEPLLAPVLDAGGGAKRRARRDPVRDLEAARGLAAAEWRRLPEAVRSLREPARYPVRASRALLERTRGAGEPKEVS